MSEEKELYEEMQPDAASEEKAEEILEEDDKALAEEATCEEAVEEQKSMKNERQPIKRAC